MNPDLRQTDGLSLGGKIRWSEETSRSVAAVVAAGRTHVGSSVMQPRAAGIRHRRFRLLTRRWPRLSPATDVPGH